MSDVLGQPSYVNDGRYVTMVGNAHLWQSIEIRPAWHIPRIRMLLLTDLYRSFAGADTPAIETFVFLRCDDGMYTKAWASRRPQINRLPPMAVVVSDCMTCGNAKLPRVLGTVFPKKPNVHSCLLGRNFSQHPDLGIRWTLSVRSLIYLYAFNRKSL